MLMLGWLEQDSIGARSATTMSPLRTRLEREA